MKRAARWTVMVAAALFAPAAVGGPGEDAPALDFSAKEIPAPWAVTPGWRVEDGELRGEGPGGIEYRKGVRGDFTLTFRASTEEKANVEIYLLDAKGEKVSYTCAFLGKYHSVLDGVKSCLLKDDRFVNVNPRMWIFPGRMFTFEVRRAKSQYQMFLNGELGPFFVDDAPPADLDDLRLRISILTEGGKDKVRVDDVRLVFPR